MEERTDHKKLGEVISINMGPQHPSTHGVLRLVLDLDGETISNIRPDVGYLHRGTEKMAEDRTYQQFLPLTDRLDYLAPLSNNWGFCLAVEKMLPDLTIPLRAEYLRVILAELARIASHLVWLATHALDIGAMTVFLYCFRERELVLDMFEEVSGQRMTSSWICIGGVRKDITPKFTTMLYEFLEIFESRVDEYEKLLSNNRIWKARTINVGKMSREDALSYGGSGPTMRGSGVDFDLRRDEPYGIYEKFEFDIPVCDDGDIYARYIVRIEEMRQSARIVKQAIDGIPEGRVLAGAIPEGDTDYVAQDRKALRTIIAGRGMKPAEGETYACVEAPKGELGYYIISTGETKPYRLKVRGPSFVNLASVPVMCQGEMLADLVGVIGSVDIVLGEIDK